MAGRIDMVKKCFTPELDFWPEVPVTLILKFQGQISTLLYFKNVWFNTKKTESKMNHLDDMLKCIHS